MNQESVSQPATVISSSTKTIVLITACVANFFLAFMMQALNVALPQIGREFNANALLLNWIVTIYVLVVAAFSLPFGRIADIVGLKKIIILGVINYIVISSIAIFSNSAQMLIICRALQGISAAMILVNAVALTTAIYPASERGKALGISITGVYAGSSTGPFLGGILTGNFGWRSTFLLTIILAIVVLLILLWKVKGEWCGSKGQKLDYVGSGIFVLFLVALMYGFSNLPGVTGIISILIGILGLIAFVKWENRVESPILNIRVFKSNRTFILSNAAVMINYCAVFAVAFLLSLYLQYIKGLSPAEAGLIMIAHPVVQAILSPFTGRLSDKIEPRIVASAGMALTTIALLCFIFLYNDTSTGYIVMALVILGTGFAAFLSSNSNALMSSVSPKYYGVASATMSTMISGGQMLSMGITMIVTTILIGGATITPEYYPAFLTSARIAFGIFTLLCLSGVFVSYFRGQTRT